LIFFPYLADLWGPNSHIFPTMKGSAPNQLFPCITHQHMYGDMEKSCAALIVEICDLFFMKSQTCNNS